MNVESSRFSLELLQVEWGVVPGAPSGGPGGRRVTASAGWQQLVTAPVGWLARPPPLVSGVVVPRARASPVFVSTSIPPGRSCSCPEKALQGNARNAQSAAMDSEAASSKLAEARHA
jgi:hypothetical protein